MKKFIVYGLSFMVFLLSTIYYLPSTVHAEVKIGEKFGFGDIVTLGGATSKLVTPLFSIAAALVVIYFLVAAFKYLKAGSNKEDVEGAKQMITHSIIGFIILMFAFLILQVLLFKLFGITDFQIIK